MRDKDTADDDAVDTVGIGGATGGRWWASRIARLSPRQQGAMIIGSTILLGLVVLTTILLTRDDSKATAPDAHPTPAADSIAPPTSEAPVATTRLGGNRVWIGYHGVMLAAPRSWARTTSDLCGTTSSLSAAPPRAPHSKCSAPSQRQRSIVLWLRQDLERPELVDNGFHEELIGRRHLFMTAIQSAGPAYLQYVAVPDTDTLVVVRSPDRATIARLVRSLRGIPASWVTVPELRGLDPQHALSKLGELDLVGRAEHNSGMALPSMTVVVNQNPSEGQVITAQTPVTISVLPADSSP